MASAIIPNYSKLIIYYLYYAWKKECYFDWQVQKDNKIISCDSKVRFVNTLRHLIKINFQIKKYNLFLI